MSRIGFAPFILLSILIHGLGAFIIALSPVVRFSAPGGDLLEWRPVRVRFHEAAPAASLVTAPATPDEPARGRSAPAPPSLSRLPQSRPLARKNPPSADPPTVRQQISKLSTGVGAEIKAEKKISVEEIPSVATPVAKTGTTASLLRSLTPFPESHPGPLPRLEKQPRPETAPPSAASEPKPVKAAKRKEPKHIAPVPDTSKPARPARIDRPTSQPVVNQANSVQKTPKTIARRPKEPSRARKSAAPPVVLALQPKSLAPRPKVMAPQPKAFAPRPEVHPPRPELTSEKPTTLPKDIRASVPVKDFVHVEKKSEKPRKRPRSATELLSSFSLGMNGAAAASQPAQPRSRKKARLAPLVTQDVRYRGYRYAIWKKIDERLYYPEAAAAGKVSGKVVVLFEVTRDGQLATLKLVESSGFPLFDEEALMAVRRAAPFPPFPPTLSANRLAIRSEILYEP